MGSMNRNVGTATAVLVTYGTGALISLVVWLFRRTNDVGAGGGIPWHGWLAGAFGLIIVGGISYAAPRLGLSRTLVVTVAAQLGAAMAIEHFGLMGATVRPVNMPQIAGMLLTIAGVWLAVK